MHASNRPTDDDAPKLLPFPQRAPLCAQCRIAMAIVRGEPDWADPATIMTIYRCPECGLVERRSRN
jgi:hypothetical protein